MLKNFFVEVLTVVEDHHGLTWSSSDGQKTLYRPSLNVCSCSCLGSCLGHEIGRHEDDFHSLLHSLRVFTTGLVVPSWLTLLDYVGLQNYLVGEHLQLSWVTKASEFDFAVPFVSSLGSLGNRGGKWAARPGTCWACARHDLPELCRA